MFASFNTIHATRIPIIDVALWDVVGTALVAIIVAKQMSRRFDHQLITSISLFIVFVLISIVVHISFGVRTRVVDAIDKFFKF